MDGNVKDTPPVGARSRGLEDRARFKQLAGELTRGREVPQGRRPQGGRPAGTSAQWLATATPDSVAGGVPTDRLSLLAPLTRGLGDAVAVTAGGRTRLVSPGAGYAWSATRAGSKALAVKAGKPIEVPDAGDFEKDQAFAVSAWVQAPAAPVTGAVVARMDDANGYRGWDLWLQGNRAGMHLIHNYPADALKVVAKTPLKLGSVDARHGGV